jgi:photosystem II stability/assembly factor-like uncharacterized protein
MKTSSRYLVLGLLAAAVHSIPGWAQESTAAATNNPDFVMLPALPNSDPAEAVLLDVTKTGDRLVAVGARGLIISSTDDAESWQQANVPVSQTLTAVDFASPEKGWVTGHEGIILVTTDGGRNWEIQQTGRDTVAQSIPRLEAEVARLQALLEATEDPQQQDSIGFDLEFAEAALDDAVIALEDGPTDPLLDIWFDSENHGIAVGAYGRVLETSDGGNTWESKGSLLDNPDKLHLNKVTASEDGTIYIIGEAGTAFRSDDQGRSWQKLAVPYDGSLFGAVMLGGDSLLVHGLRGNIFYSSDKGDTWQPVVTGNTSTLIGGARLNGKVVLVGASGSVLRGEVDGNGFDSRFDPGRSTLSTVIPLEGEELLLVGTDGAIKIQSFNNLKGEAL